MDVSIPGVVARPAGCDHRILASAWGEHLQREARIGTVSEATVRTYERTIRPWLAFLEDAGIDAPTPRTVGDFLASLIGRPAATRNAYLHAVRGLYRWAESEDRYPAIARSLRSVRERRDGPLPVLNAGDLDRLLTAVGTVAEPGRSLAPWETKFHELILARNRAFVRVLYGTGLRLVSMARSDVDDVLLNDDPALMRHQGKGARSKDDIAALPRLAAESIRTYLSLRSDLDVHGTALWVRLRGKVGERLTTVSMRGIITKAMDAIGLRPRNAAGNLLQPRVYGPHCLRRTSVTQVSAMAGLDVGRQFAGHSSIEVTRRSYARVSRHQALVAIADHLDIGDKPQ